MKNTILIILVTLLNLCNGQNKSTVEEKIKGTENSKDPNETDNDGVIYFSFDNGLTWKNTSAGLPYKISLGLGGIAVSPNSLAIATKENGLYIFDFKKNIWVNIPTDKKIIESNLGSLIFYKDKIYAGTQFDGVFNFNMQSKDWTSSSLGLGNLSIRKFTEIDNILYVGTNGGLYSFNEKLNIWEFEYGNNSLQVNGITQFGENIFIGTNQGAFKTLKNHKEWRQVLSGRSLHNISSDEKAIYAMVYNELLTSVNNGESWHSIQKGMPEGLYTFNVIKNGNSVFAGQWDGVYRKDSPTKDWEYSSNGLPQKFAVTNMKLYKGIIIISTSERKLKEGISIKK